MNGYAGTRFLKHLFLGSLVVLTDGCGPAAPKVSGTAYYVDCGGGDDANSGRSASQAWRTLAKVNTAALAPGDGVFFKRGGTCAGALRPRGSGSDGQPLTLGAYGQGPAPIIAGGQNTTTLLQDQAYWHIQDLELTGGTEFGLHITGPAGAGVLKHFRLANVVVHDVIGGKLKDKVSGLVVVSSGGDINTFDDVIVDQVTAYNTNQWGGIVIQGLAGDFRANPPNLSTNVTVRNCTVHNVYGDGILLWGVQTGLIERSLAYETGLQPPTQTIGTPSFIWTWMCHDCTVQYNESYAAHSPDVDGGAYDIDWGTQDNFYQYNYGHDTDSCCISVFGSGGLTTTNAVIRYNVCTNNGRDKAQAATAGAVLLYTRNGGTLDGVQIYNNTIYWNPDQNSNAVVNQAAFTDSRPDFFRNNLVYSTASWILFTNSKLGFDHNLYWYPGDKETVWLVGKIDGDAYRGFSQYQAKTGQDAHSVFADPQLNDVTYHANGRPKTAFTLQPGSPAIDAGVDVGNMGPVDFYGARVPFGVGYDVGAIESQGK
jgi:hypothetical protein